MKTAICQYCGNKQKIRKTVPRTTHFTCRDCKTIDKIEQHKFYTVSNSEYFGLSVIISRDRCGYTGKAILHDTDDVDKVIALVVKLTDRGYKYYGLNKPQFLTI